MRTVWRFVDGRMFLVAFTPTNPAADKALRSSFPRPRPADMPPFLPVLEGRTEQIADIEAQTAVPALLRGPGAIARLSQHPVHAADEQRGRHWHDQGHAQEAGAFVTADVQLLRTFADQAVIAIENVRLFDEAQARTTRPSQKRWQQQTATAECPQGHQPFGVRSGRGPQDPDRFRAVAQRRGDCGGVPARRRALPASRRVGGCSGIS